MMPAAADLCTAEGWIDVLDFSDLEAEGLPLLCVEAPVEKTGDVVGKEEMEHEQAR